MKKRGRLWQVAFIVGMVYYIPITILMLWFGVWIASSGNLPWFIPLLVSIILLGSIALARKWTLVSGGMLVIESLFLICSGIIFEEDPSIVWSLIFFLPALIVGILFIISWFRTRGRSLDVYPE